jgi:hypothetical protein
MAEDFPEEKYDFRPAPAQLSFAEQLLHAAGACYYFTNPVPREKVRSGTNTNPMPTSLRSSRNPSPMARPPSSRKAKR